jgi:light-regulated signal transduction histidine kinase (bacteriophytochrome)
VTDLTDCDREPIHIPGAIQPHGVLVVLAEPALTIAQVSENVGDHLPLDAAGILGQPLSTIIDDPASVGEVREALREERWREMNPLHIVAHGRRFDGIVHRHEGAAMLELEPDPEPLVGVHHPFRTALVQVQRVSTLAELADIVVRQLRQITGFERVMFYRFHEDGHGSVDAEAKEPALEPYLGLHYPASDIRLKRAGSTSRTGCGSSSMLAPRRRGSSPPSAWTRAGPWTSASRCCAASRRFTSSTWPTWESARP